MTTRLPRLWAVVGATGTGKTAFSLDLAEHISATHHVDAEIVNADAMQLYRGMEIGTAKLPVAERRGIAHHLFDALNPSEEATVAWYQPTVRRVIAEIQSRGHDAILVGGSGLYVSSALFEFEFPPRDTALRAEIEAQLEREGIESVLARLREIAPTVAEAVDARNPRRVVRALEVALLGQDARVTLPEAPKLWLPNSQIIGMHAERAALVARLDRRVEQMWADGLVDEVKSLLPAGLEHGKTASRAIGYAQAIAQLRGSLTEAHAIAETQALTRRYARRQVSWFKRYAGLRWVEGGAAFSPDELPQEPPHSTGLRV